MKCSSSSLYDTIWTLCLRAKISLRAGLLALVALVGVCSPAHAVKLSDLFDNLGGESGKIGNSLLTMAALVGIVFIIVGVIKLRGNDRGEGPSSAFKYFIIGALLIAIPALTLAFNASVFGESGGGDLDFLDIP